MKGKKFNFIIKLKSAYEIYSYNSYNIGISKILELWYL